MNVRPSVPEDCLDYRLYPAACETAEELAARLLTYQEWLYTVFPFLATYIWQRDPFQLSVDAAARPPALVGSTRFGDNIEDEWFVPAPSVCRSIHLTPLSLAGSSSFS